MLEIDPGDRELLAPAMESLIENLPPTSKQRRVYLELLAALGSGRITDACVPALEQVLDLYLSSGHARKAHGPFEEQQLLRLYQRTPAGSRAREHLQQLNAALDGLVGQRLEGLSFAMRTPGAYRLEIDTEQCRLAITIDRHGVAVHQLEVGV